MMQAYVHEQMPMQAQERWVLVQSQLELELRCYLPQIDNHIEKTAMRRISEDDAGAGCRRAPNSAAARTREGTLATVIQILMPLVALLYTRLSIL
jgi:hypothetical protein